MFASDVFVVIAGYLGVYYLSFDEQQVFGMDVYCLLSL